MRRRFALGCLFALLFALGWWAGRGGASSDLYTRLDTFIEILHKVEENYVEPVEPRRLIEGAARGMLRSLDPYAEFLSGREITERRLRTEDRADIGLALGARESGWTVIAPRAGGPAATAGVRAGDALLKVDGRSTSGWTLAETTARLSGPRGTRVRLSVLHPGEETPREITVPRESTGESAPPVASESERGIGTARLDGIGAATAPALRRELERLRAGGVSRFVLDLRGCATGSPEDGARVAELFLAVGTTIAVSHGRGNEGGEKLVAAAPNPTLGWPLVVLVDEGTAGAAEVVAGALQDADRALIVGHTTFGLASVQREFPLEGGAALLRLTTAFEETPSGRPIQRLAGLEDDDEEGGASGDSTSADSAAHATFRTRSGRRVEGGGGIHPDLEVAPDSLSRASAATRVASTVDEIERRALAVLRRARAPHDVFAAPPASPRERAR